MFPEHFFAILALCALLAAGSGGMLIWLGGPAAGPRWAELGTGVGFLAGFVALAEGLPLVDDIANPALGEAILGLIAAGALIALVRLRGRLGVWIAAVLGIGVSAWVFAGPDFVIVQTADLFALAALGIAAFCVAFRLNIIATASAPPIFILAILALGLTGIALTDHATTMAALDLAYDATLLGALVWSRPLHRSHFDAPGLALGTGLIMGLAAAMTRNAPTPPWGLLPLLGCLFPGPLLDRLPLSKRLRRNKPLRPYLLGIAALIPAAFGVALSAILTAIG